MKKRYIDVGAYPCLEAGATRGQDNFLEENELECRVFLNQVLRLIKELGWEKDIPSDVKFVIKSYSNDPNDGLTVAIEHNGEPFDPEIDHTDVDYDYMRAIDRLAVVQNISEWDDEAEKELGWPPELLSRHRGEVQAETIESDQYLYEVDVEIVRTYREKRIVRASSLYEAGEKAKSNDIVERFVEPIENEEVIVDSIELAEDKYE